MTGKTKRLNFWAPDNVIEEIATRREDFSDSIREGLGRYYYLLALGRHQLKGVFAQGELGLMLDLCNGTIFEPHSLIGGIAANCEDAEDFYYDEKWKVDRKTLLAKLKALPYGEEAALVDAIERWWKRVGDGAQPEIDELLK